MFTLSLELFSCSHCTTLLLNNFISYGLQTCLLCAFLVCILICVHCDLRQILQKKSRNVFFWLILWCFWNLMRLADAWLLRFMIGLCKNLRNSVFWDRLSFVSSDSLIKKDFCNAQFSKLIFKSAQRQANFKCDFFMAKFFKILTIFFRTKQKKASQKITSINRSFLNKKFL